MFVVVWINTYWFCGQRTIPARECYQRAVSESDANERVLLESELFHSCIESTIARGITVLSERVLWESFVRKCSQRVL